MRKPVVFVVAALCVSGFITANAMAAPGDKIGDTQMCVDSNDIDQSPVVDHHTIVLKMRAPSKGYRRVDLQKNCTLDRSTGFSWTTSIDKLCKSDTLKELEVAGEICVIEQIVTIDKVEADALMRKKP